MIISYDTGTKQQQATIKHFIKVGRQSLGGGSNSTVTTELRTAGVVISSLGLVFPFLVSVVLACIGCIACVAACTEALYCVEDVKEWMAERRQEPRGQCACCDYWEY